VLLITPLENPWKNEANGTGITSNGGRELRQSPVKVSGGGGVRGGGCAAAFPCSDHHQTSWI